ncbi:MAG: pyruvate kinase [Eubacteriales bacterium]
MTRKTKIICTLGPATDREGVLEELMKNGLNVARLNFSHGSHEEHAKRIAQVKQLREKLQIPVGILLDTRGPEIRVKTFAQGQVELKEGATFTLTARPVEGTEEEVSITYDALAQDVQPGTRILLDDGLIELRVEAVEDTDIRCVVLNGGVLSNNKSLNIPDSHLSLPYMNDKDREDLLFGIEQGVDFVAASFVRSRNDVLEVRKILESGGGANIQIIAKIENREGVRNFEEILKVCDGVMVARGDLGVEIPFAEIPKIQKMMIRKGRQEGKVVITATQMLDSMIRNPRPTRAETSDVANAIYDGSGAIMLSGETAMGKYPVEALVAMNDIAQGAESDINYLRRFKQMDTAISANITNAISHATCTTAHDLGARAIITVTNSGHTARMVCKYRPNCPIIATTAYEKVYHQMSLLWGVTPFRSELQSTTDELFDSAVRAAEKSGMVESGDLVVITAGVPVGISGTTNILKVQIVGNVLVRGERVNQQVAYGNLRVCHTEKEALDNFVPGEILVIPETSNELLTVLKGARAIITEASGLTSHAAIVGLSLDIPVVCGAKNATNLLKSGLAVTVDSSRGLVLGGISQSQAE